MVHGLGLAAIALMALVTVVSVVLAVRSRRLALERVAEMAKAMERGERDTERFVASARIATDLLLDDRARMQALLDRVTASIRPGIPFFGTFGLVTGPEAFVIAHAAEAEGPGSPTIPVGSRIALAQTLAADLLGASGVIAWDDLAGTAAQAARPFVRERLLRSAIGTAFRVSNRTYFLLFTSQHPMLEPFDQTDRVYVELLAQFTAQRIRQRDQTERLRFDANHDRLTELPNRVYFRQEVTQSQGKTAAGAILVIELEHFRELKRALGNQTADAVIVEIACALVRAAEPGELLTRLGNDLFAIFLPAAGLDSARARSAAVLELFAEPFGTGDRLQQEKVPVRASIGVALYGGERETFEQVLSLAQTAAGRAHSEGDRIACFGPTEQALLEERQAQRIAVAHALRDSQFTLYYQPIVSLASAAVVGAEALVRWNHPARGLLAAELFVPFADENGLIGELGRWAFARAFDDLHAIGAVDPDLVVHVNVWAREILDERFVAGIRACVADDPVRAHHIGVEIKEGNAMQDDDRTDRVMDELRALGLTTTIDNFGAGNASLNRLKACAIDAVKIGHEFVAGLPHDAYDVALIATLVALTRRLGVAAVAEGIERGEQRDWLRDHGIDQGQGYAIAAPMPLDSFVKWIGEHRTTGRSLTGPRPMLAHEA